MKSSSKRILVATGLVASCAAALFARRLLADGIPATGALTYSGLLQDAGGQALTGTHPVQVSFFTAATGTTPTVCYTSPSGKEALEGGGFSVPLADACASLVKANKDIWVEVLVDGTGLGRTKLGAVPYAVEAGHATGADTATSATSATSAMTATSATTAAGSLLTTVTQIQADITALKSSYVTSSGYTVAPLVLVDHAQFVWVSGATPINVAAGQVVFVSNTSQTWAANSNHGTPGCASCVSGTAVLKACYRVGTAIPTLTPTAYTQSDVAERNVGSETSANGLFTFTAATNNVSFGLCGRLYDDAATRWDMNVGNVHTLVQGHK